MDKRAPPNMKKRRYTKKKQSQSSVMNRWVLTPTGSVKPKMENVTTVVRPALAPAPSPVMQKPKIEPPKPKTLMVSNPPIIHPTVKPKTLTVSNPPIIQPTVKPKILTLLPEPTKRSDLLGNKEQIKQFYEWLESKKNKDPDIRNSVLLSGGTGCGKTSLVRVALKECGFSTMLIDSAKVIDHADFSTEMKIAQKLVEISSRSQILGNPMAIVVEEIDVIYQLLGSVVDKTSQIVSAVRKLNHQSTPVIFTCTTMDVERVRQIRDVSSNIQMWTPKERDLIGLAKNISNFTSYFSANEDVIDTMAKECRGDIRKLLNSLIFYSRKVDNVNLDSSSTPEQVKSFFLASLQNNDSKKREIMHNFKTAIRTDPSLDIFETTRKVLADNAISTATSVLLCEIEPKRTTLMLHENYISVYSGTTIKNKVKNWPQSSGDVLDCIVKMSHMFVDTDRDDWVVSKDSDIYEEELAFIKATSCKVNRPATSTKVYRPFIEYTQHQAYDNIEKQIRTKKLTVGDKLQKYVAHENVEKDKLFILPHRVDKEDLLEQDLVLSVMSKDDVDVTKFNVMQLNDPKYEQLIKKINTGQKEHNSSFIVNATDRKPPKILKPQGKKRKVPQWTTVNPKKVKINIK